MDATSDPSWDVRNSASLAFTSLLVRGVGYKNSGMAARPKFCWAAWGPAAAAAWAAGSAREASGQGSSPGDQPRAAEEEGSRLAGSGGGRGEDHGAAVVSSLSFTKAPTAAEFFERFPALHGYMLRHLQAAAAALAPTSDRGSGGKQAATEVHPGLFRVLLILKRLKPSVVFKTGSAEGPVSPAILVDPLLAVARSPVMGVRQLAALALGPLVPRERRLRVAADLAAGLPRGGGAISDHNALHGALMQLEVLLETELLSGSGSSSGGSGGSSSGEPAAAAGGEEAATAQHAADESGGEADGICGAFVEASWIAGPACRCAPVRAAFVRAAARALELQQRRVRGTEFAERLRSCLEASCLDAVRSTAAAPGSGASFSSSSSSDAAPQQAWWLKQCSSLLLGPLVAASLSPTSMNGGGNGTEPAAAAGGGGGIIDALVDQLSWRLAEALKSSEYEVRATAAKVAAKQLPAQLPAGAAVGPATLGKLQEVEAAAWEQLGGESNVKVRRRLLALAALLQQVQEQVAAAQLKEPAVAAGTEAAVALRRFEQARAALSGTTDVTAQAQALECMARAARPLVAAAATAAATGGGSSSTSASAAGAILQLAATLQSFSRPAQPDPVRLAAARVLGTSGLLLPFVDGSNSTTSSISSSGIDLSRTSLQCWWVAVCLMDDDEAGVRATAAAAAQAAMAADQTSPLSSSSSAAVAGGEAAAMSQPLYEEAVKPRAFALIAARCGAAAAAALQLQKDGALLLATAVFDPSLPPPSVLDSLATAAARAAAAPAAAAGLTVRRLFDREADNHHEEPLHSAQLAARALAALLPRLPPGGPAAAAVAEWAAGAGAWLSGFAARLGALPGHGACAWVGGIGNHPEVFVPLSRCLLAAQVAGAAAVGAAGALPALRRAGPPLALSQQVERAEGGGARQLGRLRLAGGGGGGGGGDGKPASLEDALFLLN